MELRSLFHPPRFNIIFLITFHVELEKLTPLFALFLEQGNKYNSLVRMKIEPTTFALTNQMMLISTTNKKYYQ